MLTGKGKVAVHCFTYELPYRSEIPHNEKWRGKAPSHSVALGLPLPGRETSLPA